MRPSRPAAAARSPRMQGGEPGPQAGIAVYERGQDGLLAAVRVYDDIEAPIGYP